MTTTDGTSRGHDGGQTSLKRAFFGTWGTVWILTIVGGGACGLASLGLISVALCMFTIPVGLLLGAVLGLPLGLVIAIVFTRWASPPTDTAAFVDRMALVGIGAALLPVAPINLWLLVTEIRSNDHVVAVVANSVLALAATYLVGRTSGQVLATHHLNRLGLGLAPAPRDVAAVVRAEEVVER